ncbi:hypothetical protein LAZ67_4002081 [Cordylochernes scorpioides]|uniref:Mos1 transposase HTH domain-containing protein n=1 Tax=Cordylochernes scorpioides TaxID=51811 RepID=A0ABY6KCQ3_9ARAC|nr:hypothetical protein LAZ67_4002081 [Cordylochernes scorpioides]
MVISEPKSAHLREVLLFAFNWKKSATKAHRMLEEVHGDHALSKSQCYRWFKKFQSGDFELDNEPRGKPHQKFEDAELQALLDDDSTQTQEKLAKQLQVSQGSVSLQCDQKDIQDWLECNVDDPGYQLLTDDEIIESVVDDQDSSDNEEELRNGDQGEEEKSDHTSLRSPLDPWNI